MVSSLRKSSLSPPLEIATQHKQPIVLCYWDNTNLVKYFYQFLKNFHPKISQMDYKYFQKICSENTKEHENSHRFLSYEIFFIL